MLDIYCNNLRSLWWWRVRGKKTGKMDKSVWFPPICFDCQTTPLSIYFVGQHTHTSLCKLTIRHSRLCVKRNQRILTAGLVRVTHSTTDTVSLVSSRCRALSVKWGSCQDRHWDHYKYHFFIRKYIAGVVLCRSFTWCGDGGGGGLRFLCWGM